MLVRRVLCNFLDVFVAGITDKRREIFNEFRVAASVRIVALRAIPRHQGFVNDFLRRLLQMAIFAEILPFAQELPGMFIRIQRLMARSALTQTYRSVNVGFLTIVGMTFCRDTCLLKRGWFFHRKRDGGYHTHQQNRRLVYSV